MSPERSLTRHHTLETRRKISLARKGIPRSEETKRAISNSLMGHVLSEETRAKISLVKREKNSLKKQDPQIVESPGVEEEIVEEEDIDLNLWRSAIEENLIGPILNQNLLTKEEIDKIKRNLEAGRKPPEKLMDKFSIAIARTA